MYTNVSSIEVKRRRTCGIWADCKCNGRYSINPCSRSCFTRHQPIPPFLFPPTLPLQSQAPSTVAVCRMPDLCTFNSISTLHLIPVYTLCFAWSTCKCTDSHDFTFLSAVESREITIYDYDYTSGSSPKSIIIMFKTGRCLKSSLLWNGVILLENSCLPTQPKSRSHQGEKGKTYMNPTECKRIT